MKSIQIFIIFSIIIAGCKEEKSLDYYEGSPSGTFLKPPTEIKQDTVSEVVGEYTDNTGNSYIRFNSDSTYYYMWNICTQAKIDSGNFSVDSNIISFSSIIDSVSDTYSPLDENKMKIVSGDIYYINSNTDNYFKKTYTY